MSRQKIQLTLGLVFLALASAISLKLHARYHAILPHYAFLTGWVLLGGMFVLTIYNVRKKLPFLPLGRSETWLQIHIYLGFFTTLLFLIHLKFRLPHGIFDWLLALFFIGVSASGVVGLYFSRTLPRRLSSKGGEVLFEKIPELRHSLNAQAEKLALGPDSKSPAIADLYLNQLVDFFSGPRNTWAHLTESNRPLIAVQSKLDVMQRYSNDTDRKVLDALAELVRQKDGLDYHRTHQLTLRLWLFVHIPLTYGLMIFTAFHIVLVFAFSGGAR